MISNEGGTRRDRGLAMAIGLFFASLIIGALLYFVVREPSLATIDLAEQHTSRQSSAQGQNFARLAITNAHLIVVGFGALWLIATAVYESRAGGGF